MPAQPPSPLSRLGWNPWFEERFAAFAAEGLLAARVTADHGTEYIVHDGMAASRAVVSRRTRNEGGMLPAVGDWVALRSGDGASAIVGVVERRTSFSRKVASNETREQILAANVDLAFIVASAQDVNVRRVERYLTMAWQSGANPVVLLTKADIAGSAAQLQVELESVSVGTPVMVTSSVTGEGLEAIARLLQPALTGVLLGPSGAGKSTLINRMTGVELMKTRTVFRSGEGRHATSHRQLIELPAGGMIIDTPGLREAQLWEGEGALGDLFNDIEQLALRCRFSDCSHRTEPGCAVKAALASGSLDLQRLASYRKLQRELRAVAARSDARLRADERRKWKLIASANKARDDYLR